MKNYPKNTHNPGRKQKPGRGNAMNSLGAPVQNEGVQYAQDTPELDKSQVDYGSTQFGKGTNQIGGTNTSAQLAQLLGAAVKTTETVVDIAHKWQKEEDKEIEELRIDEMQELMRTGVNGKAWVNMTDVEKATAANSVNRRAVDAMTLKSSKQPLENKMFETEMQMPGTQYKDMVAAYKAKKNFILSDPTIENESERVDELETLNREWAQLVKNEFSDNRDIMEAAEDTIAGHAVADRTAVETEAVRELTNHKPEITAEVERMVAEQMAGGVPPLNDTEFAKAVLEATGYPSVYLEESDGAVLKAFGPVFNKFVEDTRRRAMEAQKVKVKNFTSTQHTTDLGTLQNSEYGLGADWPAIMVSRNSLGLVLDQADTEEAKDVAVMRQFEAEINNLIMRSTDTEENNRMQAGLIIDGLMEIRGIGGQQLRKRMEAHISSKRVNPLNFDAVENSFDEQNLEKTLRIAAENPVMVLPALRVSLEKIALNELPRTMAKVSGGLNPTQSGELEKIATRAMLNLVAGSNTSYLEEFHRAATGSKHLSFEQVNAAAIGIISEPSSALWLDNMEDLNNGYENQSVMAQRLLDSIGQPGGVKIDPATGKLMDPAPEVNALTGKQSLTKTPAERNSYLTNQDLQVLDIPIADPYSDKMGNFMYGMVEDLMAIPGMTSALRDSDAEARSAILHDYFKKRVNVGVTPEDCRILANTIHDQLASQKAFDPTDPKSVKAWLSESRDKIVESSRTLSTRMIDKQISAGPGFLSGWQGSKRELDPAEKKNHDLINAQAWLKDPTKYMTYELVTKIDGLASPEDAIAFIKEHDLEINQPEVNGDTWDINPQVTVSDDSVKETANTLVWSVTDSGDVGPSSRMGKNFTAQKQTRDEMRNTAAVISMTGSENQVTQNFAGILRTLADPTPETWSKLRKMQKYTGNDKEGQGFTSQEAYLVQMLFGRETTQIDQGRLVLMTMLAEGSPGTLDKFVGDKVDGFGAFEDLRKSLTRDESGNWMTQIGTDGYGSGVYRSQRFATPLLGVADGFDDAPPDSNVPVIEKSVAGGITHTARAQSDAFGSLVAGVSAWWNSDDDDEEKNP